MEKEVKKRKLKKLLILLVLSWLAINLSFVTAIISIKLFGTLTLSPGEKYTLNIPFIGPLNNPIICGRAIQTNGTFLQNITVIATYKDNSTILKQNTTNSKGEFCLVLPKINRSAQFDVSVQYDNSTLTLGSNDYTLDFDNNKVYIKRTDAYAILSGTILNEDAPIENGRFEIKMGQKINGSWKYIYGDYEKYFVNIPSNEIYQVPNEELNFSRAIAPLEIGEYKFLIKTSFNGKEYPSSCSKCSVYFNITE